MKIKQLLVIPLVGIFSMSALAQQSMPGKGTLSNSSAKSVDVTSQIDGLIKEGTGSIMSGITGYEIEVSDLIKEYVEKEIVEAVADAVVLAPAATAIMDAYMKMKANALADEVDKVKNLAKDAMSRQMKLEYQDYKVKYEKLLAKATPAAAVKNSVTGSGLSTGYSDMYQKYVKVMNEIESPSDSKLLKAHDPLLEYYVVGAGMKLSSTDDLKAKQAMATDEFDPSQDNSSAPVTGRSAYERMVINRQIAKEINARQGALVRYKKQMANVIQQMRRKAYEKTYRDNLNVKTY